MEGACLITISPWYGLISLYRSKRNVSLCSLSVDELCDHVNTFEHGKVNTHEHIH